MSEPTATPAAGAGVAVAVDDDDWLTAAPAESLPGGDEKEPPTSRRTLAVRAGLIVAGAVVGGVVVASVSHGGATTTANGVPASAIAGLGNGQFPNVGGRLGGGPGGLAGDQHLFGSLVSVGSSSVTVKTSSGTATYDVTSASQIVRNGQLVALSALRPGDEVFVHVYSSGSGSRLTVERLFVTAGTSSGTRT